MNPIQSRLQAHAPLILDGALATELERKGCNLNDSLWSAKILIEQPELIQQVHLDYFQAGADCATTASYQTTIDGFAEKGYSKEEAIELMKRSVTLAKEARDLFWQDEAVVKGGQNHLLQDLWGHSALIYLMVQNIKEITGLQSRHSLIFIDQGFRH